MSDCCSVENNTPLRSKRHSCPVNGQSYTTVSNTTILHHLKQPWLYDLNEHDYYFCSDPDCEVVYFAEDNSVIKQSQLRTEVGIKQDSADATLCYCFGISKQEAETNTQLKSFVLEQTKQASCACEIRNPSGRCCLKDFL